MSRKSFGMGDPSLSHLAVCLSRLQREIAGGCPGARRERHEVVQALCGRLSGF